MRRLTWLGRDEATVTPGPNSQPILPPGPCTSPTSARLVQPIPKEAEVICVPVRLKYKWPGSGAPTLCMNGQDLGAQSRWLTRRFYSGRSAASQQHTQPSRAAIEPSLSVIIPGKFQAESRSRCAGFCLTRRTWAEAQAALAAGMAACLAALDPQCLDTNPTPRTGSSSSSTAQDPSAQPAAAMLLPEAAVEQAGTVHPDGALAAQGAQSAHGALPEDERANAGQPPLLAGKTACLIRFLQGCKVRRAVARCRSTRQEVPCEPM